MIKLKDMVDSNPINEEFGQPDTNYNDAPSLISAVHTYPRRFSPETREFVAKLALETATQPQLGLYPRVQL